jgi:hypothetical protein
MSEVGNILTAFANTARDISILSKSSPPAGFTAAYASDNTPTLRIWVGGRLAAIEFLS